jgi:hypothetical protein
VVVRVHPAVTVIVRHNGASLTVPAASAAPPATPVVIPPAALTTADPPADKSVGPADPGTVVVEPSALYGGAGGVGAVLGGAGGVGTLNVRPSRLPPPAPIPAPAKPAARTTMPVADLGDWHAHLLAPGRLEVTDVEVGKGSNGLVMEGVLGGTERVCCKVSEIGTGCSVGMVPASPASPAASN